jgi:hypothetical protein
VFTGPVFTGLVFTGLVFTGLVFTGLRDSLPPYGRGGNFETMGWIKLARRPQGHDGISDHWSTLAT